MQENNQRMNVLHSPLFILSLSVLLLNDWYLKYQFHNWLTGKLSDISGLIVFYLFLYAFTTVRTKLLIWLTAILFVFWKSALSQGIIDWLNVWVPIHIDRVVDYTDCFVLPVLMLARRCAEKSQEKRVENGWRYSVVILSVFAITGTSTIPQRTEAEIELDNKISIVRKDKVSSYEYKRRDIDPLIVSRIEKLLSTFPGQDVLAQHGVRLGRWDSDVMSAITYDFDWFYINTWVFHAKPNKITQYYIIPRESCDKQMAMNEQNVTPFASAYIEFKRKENGAELKELDIKLCDLPSKKDEQDALVYFGEVILAPIEQAFY